MIEPTDHCVSFDDGGSAPQNAELTIRLSQTPSLSLTTIHQLTLSIANHASSRRYLRHIYYLLQELIVNVVGTPKFVANKMKSKGLQRLRWYCQVCEKQCRDENGFKCHAQSESHLRQMLVVGENAGKHISNFSAEFQSEFVKMLSRRCVC